MKVSAITNFKGLNYTNIGPVNQPKPKPEGNNADYSDKSVSFLTDRNYNSVFIKNKNTSFTGSVPAVLVEMGKQIPIAIF